MPLLSIDIEARFAKFQDALSAIEKKTQSSANNMSRAFSGLKGTLAGLGVGVSVAGLVGMVKSAIDAADHLKDLSQQTGIAVETLGGLGFAAGQAGGNLESIADAAGKLNKSIAGAAGGNKQFSDAFKALGIDIRDASGALKTADQVMVELADKFASFADGPEKAALAMRLLGKSGAEQIALLNEGGRALQQNIDYYKRYSGVTQETAEKADQFNDTLGKLGLLAGSFGRTLAAEMLPTLQSLSDALLESKENGDQFNAWAERAGTAFKYLSIGAAAAASGVNDMALKIGFAATVAKRLATMSPGELAADWNKYSESIRENNEAFSNLNSTLQNGPKEDKFETIINKLQGRINGEESLLATRNRYLQKYNEENLLSDKEYYKAKAAAQKEAIENTKKLIDNQITVLKAKKPFAKNEKEAGDIQGRIDDLHKEKDLVGVGKQRAPVLPGGGSGAAVRSDDPSRRILEGQLKALDRLSEDERTLLATRQDFLQSYYQQDLISITDYYDARRAAQEEALRAQEANINEEIAILQASKPKDKRSAAERDNKVEELEAKKASLQKAAGLEAVRSLIEQEKAARDFERSLHDINIQLLEQQGHMVQAAALRFDQSFGGVAKKLELERQSAVNRGDTAKVAGYDADIAHLAAMRELTIAHSKLNALDSVGSAIQEELAIATERAYIAAQTGAATELETLRQVSDARLQSAADLAVVADAFEKVAKAANDPNMILQAKRMQVEVEKMAASADLVREKFADMFSGSFESALEKLMSGTASIKDVFKAFLNDIASQFNQIISKNISDQLFSKQGALGGVVDFVSSAFGGKAAAPSISQGVSGSVANAVGGATDTAAIAATSAAMTTLATATTTADAAIVTFAASVPLANTAVTTLGATTVGANASLLALTTAAGAAASALAAVAASSSAKAGGDVVKAIAAVASAKGNAFTAGNVIPFAKGGLPNLVDKPTYFPMAGGKTGLMGEAGPEAIMPLKRDSKGSLAVSMIGERGNVTLLPITRDRSGRMAVKAYAKGGAFAKGSEIAARQAAHAVPASAEPGAEVVPFIQTVNFYNNGPIDRAAQSQVAAAAMRGGQHAARRNGG